MLLAAVRTGCSGMPGWRRSKTIRTRSQRLKVTGQPEAAQQYFPTYRIDKDAIEIAVKEYELAASALTADQKSATAATGIIAVGLGLVTSSVGSAAQSGALQSAINGLGHHADIMAAIIVLVPLFLALTYFSSLQHGAVNAARKIVVLRRLLGIDYGSVESVLPVDQVDGANEPFAIKLFPSLKSASLVAPYLIILFSSIISWIIVYQLSIATHSYVYAISRRTTISKYYICDIAALLTASTAMFFYRWLLFDTFESWRLLIGKLVGGLLRVPVHRRVGHVLYRLELAVAEARRTKINLKFFHPALVRMEDRRFYNHNGNSIASIASAARRIIKYRKISGGSTIEQQLIRSNFLKRLDPPFRRKILEWILAPWISRQFTKPGILDLYLCSVRFDRNVFGIAAALRHFFPGLKLGQPVSQAQRFLIVERLSNVSGSFPHPRIQALARDFLAHGLLSQSDFIEINAAYEALFLTGAIKLKHGQSIIISAQ